MSPQQIRQALEAYVKAQQPTYKPSRDGTSLDITSQGKTTTISKGSAAPVNSRLLAYK